MKEMRFAAQLAHPNIVRTITAGKDETRQVPYVVMELLRGQNLRLVVMGEGGRLDWLTATTFVLQVARALQYMHESGPEGRPIVHRDIKPANIFLTEDGVIKVLDFGLARAVRGKATLTEESLSQSLTQNGLFVGSIDYAAPEQIMEAKGVDERADIYSLGATLYYLIEGKPMFSKSTDIAIVHAKLHGKSPPISPSTRAPSSLTKLYAAMVAQDKEARPPSMKIVADELERFTSVDLATDTEGQKAVQGGFLGSLGDWIPPRLTGLARSLRK